jgi:hypothetical protein
MNLVSTPLFFSMNVMASLNKGLRKQTRYDLNKCSKLYAILNLHQKKFVGEDGIIHVLGWKVCLKFDGKDKILVPKLNWLSKHIGKRKATSDMPRVQ